MGNSSGRPCAITDEGTYPCEQWETELRASRLALAKEARKSQLSAVMPELQRKLSSTKPSTIDPAYTDKSVPI